MADYIQISAKTVDEAVTKALIELGITSDKLEYEVVEKGSAVSLESVPSRRSSKPEKKWMS